jgi:hypothetical protein
VAGHDAKWRGYDTDESPGPEGRKVSGVQGARLFPGRATTHYRFASYTLEMSFMGQKTVTPTSIEEELWVTDQVPDASSRLGRTSRCCEPE